MPNWTSIIRSNYGIGLANVYCPKFKCYNNAITDSSTPGEDPAFPNEYMRIVLIWVPVQLCYSKLNFWLALSKITTAKRFSRMKSRPADICQVRQLLNGKWTRTHSLQPETPWVRSLEHGWNIIRKVRCLKAKFTETTYLNSLKELAHVMFPRQDNESRKAVLD